jgi:hypothetical protein
MIQVVHERSAKPCHSAWNEMERKNGFPPAKQEQQNDPWKLNCEVVFMDEPTEWITKQIDSELHRDL